MNYPNLKFISLWFKYSFSKYSRYKYIFLEIYKSKPQTLIEIGVYKGVRSLEMIELALNFKKKINFYGFDLFENTSSKKIKKELSKKSLSAKQIKNKLYKYIDKKNVKVKLIKGDTINSLKKIKLKKKADFVFIDGGHSIKTIKNDWKNIQKLTHDDSVVIFDDYYDNDLVSKKFGCKKIIDNLDKNYKYKIYQSSDFAKISLKQVKNTLVKVTKKITSK